MSKYKHQLSLEKITNYYRKKGTVIWPSQITVCRVKIQTPTITGKKYYQKKRYSRLATSDNPLLCQNTNTNYHWKKLLPGKKGTVIWPSQKTVCRVKIQTPNVDT
jgi:hypothetical protein